MSGIDLRVIAPIPTGFFHCPHCEQFFVQAGIGGQVHREQLEEYPQAILQDASRLAEWLEDLVRRFRNQLRIQVVDPQSLQGFVLSLRHRVREYPAFVVEGRMLYAGWERNALDHLLQECLSEQRHPHQAPAR